jgi:hypothetical protein
MIPLDMQNNFRRNQPTRLHYRRADPKDKQPRRPFYLQGLSTKIVSLKWNPGKLSVDTTFQKLFSSALKLQLTKSNTQKKKKNSTFNVFKILH